MSAPSSPVALLDQLDELRANATPGPWALNPVDDRDVDAPGAQEWVAEVKARPAAPNAALIVAAVNAVGPLVAAVRAVLELHAPLDRGAGPQCQGCATHVTFTRWPCPTIAAATVALSVTP